MHRASGTDVAVKSCSKRLMGCGDVAALRREVEVLHHLAGHPGIGQLLGCHEEPDTMHLVFELYTVRESSVKR